MYIHKYMPIFCDNYCIKINHNIQYIEYGVYKTEKKKCDKNTFVGFTDIRLMR